MPNDPDQGERVIFVGWKIHENSKSSITCKIDNPITSKIQYDQITKIIKVHYSALTKRLWFTINNVPTSGFSFKFSRIASSCFLEQEKNESYTIAPEAGLLKGPACPGYSGAGPGFSDTAHVFTADPWHGPFRPTVPAPAGPLYNWKKGEGGQGPGTFLSLRAIPDQESYCAQL